MTRPRHFHILYCLRYFRYGLLLCLVPMVQALLRFDLASFYAALRQDAVILAGCAALALALWTRTGFWLSPGAVQAQTGFAAKSRRTFSQKSLAALEITRPLHCRVLGASRVVLYFKNYARPRTYAFVLRRRDALALADALMPVRFDASVFEPAGFEKLALGMLSANAATAGVFGVMGFRRMREVLGDDFRDMALGQLARMELIAARWLPAGLAVLATAVFVLISFTFLYALLRAVGFSVCRSGGVIVSRGGLVTKTERRIFLACVSACDMRVTPAARLLRRYPLYVRAGSFAGGELPLLVCRKGHEQLAQALLPGFSLPDRPLCTPGRKSPVQYFWMPGTCLVLSAALCGVSSWALPGALPVLAVPVFLSLCSLLVSAEGLLREGVCGNANRTLSLCFTRFFTRHEVCVFTPDIACTLQQNPFSLRAGRCDVLVHLPCRARYKLRGVLLHAAQALPFTL